MAEGVAAGLRPDAQPVWSRADRDTRAEAARARVDRVHLGAIAARKPKRPAVGRYPAHVGRTVRDVPGGNDPASGEAQDADGPRGTVGDIEKARIAAWIQAGGRRPCADEPPHAELSGVDEPHPGPGHIG